MRHERYDIPTIARIVKGQMMQQKMEAQIDTLLLDSRKIVYPENSLFFAIKGQMHDGHAFIADLYERKIRNFIVTEKIDIGKYPEANFILVKDAVTALQKLTAHHRSLFKIPVIGITGSNGKTIVKEWLFQLLDKDYHIVRSPKSFNSQIGVPLSVWQITGDDNLAIFEAGISHPEEMDRLRSVIQPTIGIFTNIGEAHNEGFLNIRHKTKEKLKLFLNTDVLIYCSDYLEITQSILEITQLRKTGEDKEEVFKTFTWSKTLDADLAIHEINKLANSSVIKAMYGDKFISIEIPFTDDASIENGIHCWAAMLYLGYENKIIAHRMQELGAIAMRLEMKDAINNCSLINDSYNSDIGSLSIALDFLNQQNQQKKKTLILSDILQTGKDDHQLYSEVASLLQKKNVSRFIGIGEHIAKQQKIFKENPELETLFFKSTNDFLKSFSTIPFSHETILVKGARPFAFERISQVLEQKIHETVLEVNLTAIQHNLNVYNALLKPETKIMVMVKAFSYGSGSYEIANLLQFNKVDYLAVAYADEGIALRKSGIVLPVMVMNPEANSFDAMIRYDLEPEIYSLYVLEQFNAAAADFISDTKREIPIHIKLDTGMHRLGFDAEEIPALITELKRLPHLKVKSVFTHLAGSDEQALDDFTHEQIRLFQKFSDEIEHAIAYKFLRHAANSAGIVRFPESHFDMVRLGLGIYGVDSTEQLKGKLQPVSRLKTCISQIRRIKKGETVGYNRKWKATKETTMAIVGIGYADGLSRRLSNGVGKMLYKGKQVPVIGNVCMDMSMLDITGIKDAKEGDEILVFGEGLPIEQLAAWSDTIAYEILTNVSQRVKRIYYQE